MLTIRPTRIGPWLRLRMAVRATYLRWLIAYHERDIKDMSRAQEIARWELEHLPLLQAHTRMHIENLQVQLIDCELCTRTN